MSLHRSLGLLVATHSLEAAARSHRLPHLRDKLEKIVPGISEQCSSFAVDDGFVSTKARNLHAFQMSRAIPAVEHLDRATVVDIGDSAGTHLTHLRGLLPDSLNLRLVGVNLDEKAVERIRNRGIEAVCARAEEL